MSIYLNQRENDRNTVVGEIMYSREPNGICYDARVKNCTSRGLRIVASYPYLKRTRIFLHSRNKNDTSIQQAEVAWSKPEKRTDRHHPKRYMIGIRFVEN